MTTVVKQRAGHAASPATWPARQLVVHGINILRCSAAAYRPRPRNARLAVLPRGWRPGARSIAGTSSPGVLAV